MKLNPPAKLLILPQAIKESKFYFRNFVSVLLGVLLLLQCLYSNLLFSYDSTLDIEEATAVLLSMSLDGILNSLVIPQNLTLTLIH